MGSCGNGNYHVIAQLGLSLGENFDSYLCLLLLAIFLWYLLAIFLASASVDAAYSGNARKAATLAVIVIAGYGIPIVAGGNVSDVGAMIPLSIPLAYALWSFAILLASIARRAAHPQRGAGKAEPPDAMDSR